MEITKPPTKIAKVLLLGMSGAGKSALSIRLTRGEFLETDATHGLSIRKLGEEDLVPRGDSEQRSICLWDLPAVSGFYELQQIFYDQTDLGILMFDPTLAWSGEGIDIDRLKSLLNPYYSPEFPFLLVVGRVDRDHPAGHEEMLLDAFKSYAMPHYIRTSAKTGEGCEELRSSIFEHVKWDRPSWPEDSSQYRALRSEIQQLQEGGTIIITISELHRRLEVSYPEIIFAEKLVDACLSRLAVEGVVRDLRFEQYLLLHPELFVEFATAIVYSANQNSGGIGAVNQRALLSAALKLDTVPQLDAEVRNIIVQAVVREFLERRICHRVETTHSDYLIFPHRVRARDDNVTLPEQQVREEGGIFISYARADERIAKRLAWEFTSKGWPVWWDSEIPPGEFFDDAIGRALDAAKCVVTLWSKSSVKSPWVREEAAQGLKQRKLIPVLIDEVQPPLGFGLVECVQLIGWDGHRDDLEFRKLLSSVSVHLGTHASLPDEKVLEITPGESAEPAEN